ncbi:glycine cleavage system transcriptional repressor [Type-D symbiont of Plautia stali]|uniref:glycine cleavage system transcriptional repressor n=1 Tax=Type-D symbiont of Plautia stali TaxID=1560356 RepID=UPI003F6E6AAA
MVISERTGNVILSQSQPHHLVITALGVDRPGIVNTITRHVSSCGCNIEDSRLAMLGDEFTFIMLLSGSWNAITLIESTLPMKGAELELLIVMKRTNARVTPPMPATVWVQVEVPDSPHIIERFTDLFDKHQMNIAELVSRIQPAQEGIPPTLYVQMTAHSPDNHASAPFEQAFNKLCEELHAQGSIRLYSVTDDASSTA